MKIHPRSLSLLCVLALVGSRCVYADPQGEARDLRDAALKILKATADRDAAPDEMATCIFDLEKASYVLEGAHDTDSDLAKEVNSALYWARKRSTLAIDAALDKMRAGAGIKAPVVAKKDPPKVKAPVDPNEPVDPHAGIEDARKAFQEGERFAQSHTSDEYLVSLHWFQMASMYPGTDYSLKALTLAREAQNRFTSQNPSARKEVIPDTPEMKPLVEGDQAFASKRFESAIPLYHASLKMKETSIAHRKLAQTYYARAQQVKEAVIAKWDGAYAEWKSARDQAYIYRQTLGGGRRRYFNPNDPTYAAANRKLQTIIGEGNVAFDLFDKAQSEFKAVLRMAPNGKDLVAAGEIGICLSQKPEPLVRSRARTYLIGFLKDYTPANDEERTVYEYCKTELDRITK